MIWLRERIIEGFLEYTVFFILGVYLVIWLWGADRNEKISKEWLSNVREVIFDNFTVVGTGRKSVKLANA